MKTKVVFWFVFFVAVFAIAYTATDLTVKYVMADFKVTETGYTSLEVKEVPKGALQTEQYTPIQPAEGLTLEELNGFTKVTEL